MCGWLRGAIRRGPQRTSRAMYEIQGAPMHPDSDAPVSTSATGRPIVPIILSASGKKVASSYRGDAATLVSTLGDTYAFSAQFGLRTLGSMRSLQNMVAQAVLCEPVSTSEFPANREKNREFR